MACPTCDHTMHSVGVTITERRVFWCPRCGTLRVEGFGSFDEAPMLVPRCREFIERCVNVRAEDCGKVNLNVWKQSGVAECINLPDDRPK